MVEEPPTPNTEADTVTEEPLSCGAACVGGGAAEGEQAGLVWARRRGRLRAQGLLPAGGGAEMPPLSMAQLQRRGSHLQLCVLLARHGGDDADQAARVHLRRAQRGQQQAMRFCGGLVRRAGQLEFRL